MSSTQRRDTLVRDPNTPLHSFLLQRTAGPYILVRGGVYRDGRHRDCSMARCGFCRSMDWRLANNSVSWPDGAGNISGISGRSASDDNGQGDVRGTR